MKRWTSYAAALALSAGLLALAAPGCGGGATCEDTVDQLCAKACECGGSKCAFGDESSSISFDSQADCVNFLGLGCGGDSGIDYDACVAEIEGGSCSGDAYTSPDVCNAE